MTDVIIVLDEVGQDLTRRIHVMSNEPIGEPWSGRIPAWGKADAAQEGGVYHLRAEWPVREAMYWRFRCWAGDRRYPTVTWALLPGDRISVAAVDAALLFFGVFGYWPSCAWVRTWPRGLRVEEAYIPLSEDAGLDLIAVSWAPEGFVVIGGSFNQRGVRYG